ncbi:histidine kinase [Kitasatospora sp. NBC_01287]|uniref:sensor histidine kinase n=1 Tax=Kitasatospora sp. NBC_01287 TaxID=2903573 RepID=UPI0022533949|nr:histidine kinase [Kitasatospora sp. NBC_01287]MCX4747981.1 histidine kinase [Kitasatospora sp. NBC_01287]
MKTIRRSVFWTRWLHLLIGMVFYGVVVLIYPGTTGRSTAQVLTLGGAVCAVLLTAAAMIPGTRHAEGLQGRLLLRPEDPDAIGIAPSRSWADRRRTAAWLYGRVALGTAVGYLTIHTLSAVVALCAAPGRPTGPRVYGVSLPAEAGQLWYPLLAPVVLLLTLALVQLAGRAQLALAAAMLGASAAERLAAAELRAERLLERNRLARELHDSIGHALTVTVLQAGAAREVGAGDLVFVEKALGVIEDIGRRAMEDLERTLMLLRETPEAATTEQPGLDQVASLLETARAAGTRVEARIEVAAAQLPGVLSRESHRIVQEAVTNALRHAPGAALQLRIEVRDGQLRLHCANPLGTGQPWRQTRGAGLRGIRERAALLGGEATAGPADGSWQLRVRLPLRLGA